MLQTLRTDNLFLLHFNSQCTDCRKNLLKYISGQKMYNLAFDNFFQEIYNLNY